MFFEEWLLKNNIDKKLGARLLGVSGSYLTALLNGNIKNCSVSLAEKVQVLTNNQTTWVEFLEEIKMDHDTKYLTPTEKKYRDKLFVNFLKEAYRDEKKRGKGVPRSEISFRSVEERLDPESLKDVLMIKPKSLRVDPDSL